MRISISYDPVRKEARYVASDGEHRTGMINHFNLEDVKVKVSTTGPITLGFACACTGMEHCKGMRDMRLYSDFVSAFKPLATAIVKTDCCVQIDGRAFRQE